MKENEIKQLSDIEHVLLRSGIYLGSTVLTKADTFIFNNDLQKFEYKEIEYVPGFLKIIYEVLDNSVDEAIRCKFKKGNEISLTIENNKKITISDNGRGIPLKKMKDSEITMLEGALTCLRAGSNFNDDEGRNLLGMNGVGASLTNIFSKEFIAESKDGEQMGVLTCKNNLSEKSCELSKNKTSKTGTSISFIPDFKRFGLTKVDEIHEELIRQRIMFLSFTYPEIKFTYNDSLIKFKNAKLFMNYFSDNFVAVQDENKPTKYLIGVIPNTSDEFNHKSYINGADCILGGNHLDVISNELVGRIREKLSKKYPAIKNGDIKNRLSFIVNFREFINPMFNSQTKENFSSNASEIKLFLKDVNWDEFTKKICKCDEIIEPIIDSFKIKEELQNRKMLEKIGNAPKKFKCKGFVAATNSQKYFAICEGLSASAGLSEGFGRNEIGYFATRGVPLNTYEAKPERIADNEELKNIIKLLNLKLGEKEQHMTYENVLLASDQDCDGFHITELYIAFFSKYCKSVITSGHLKKLMTPIIAMKDQTGDIKEIFFNLNEYNEYIKNNKNTKLKVHYYKGLGSWRAIDLQKLIKKYGLDLFVKTLELDENAEQLIDDWNSKVKTNVRKEYLRNNEFSIFSI